MTDSVLADEQDTTLAASHVATAPASFSRNVATELVGTVLVMLAGPGLLALTGVGTTDLAVAVSVGLAMAISIGVIGAVANPLFTLALLVVREISPREAVGDWVGQFAGGLLGGALILGINGLERVSAGANGWDRDGLGGIGSALGAELVFGIVIVVVFLCAMSTGRSTMSVAAFTGAAYAIGHLVLLPIDGAGLNPARSVGSAVFADADPNALGQVWLFVLVPLVAAIAGVFVWLAIADAAIDDTIFDDTVLDDLQDRLTGDG